MLRHRGELLQRAPGTQERVWLLQLISLRPLAFAPQEPWRLPIALSLCHNIRQVEQAVAAQGIEDLHGGLQRGQRVLILYLDE